MNMYLVSFGRCSCFQFISVFFEADPWTVFLFVVIRRAECGIRQKMGSDIRTKQRSRRKSWMQCPRTSASYLESKRAFAVWGSTYSFSSLTHKHLYYWPHIQRKFNQNGLVVQFLWIFSQEHETNAERIHDECHFSYSYNVKAAMEEYAVKSDFFSFGKSAKKTFYYKSLLL